MQNRIILCSKIKNSYIILITIKKKLLYTLQQSNKVMSETIRVSKEVKRELLKIMGELQIERAESFFTLIEIFFIFVYNKFLLIKDDLSHRCGLCPKGWE